MARQWPMKEGSYTLTSGFGPRWGSHHSGLDFGAPDGTPFYACAGGTVTHIGTASGYGQWIVLDHPTSEGGGASEYGHMWNAFATGLKVGDWVEAGQLLGYVGSNGQSTGPHLHLTVWEYGYGGKRIDPEVWLKNAPHPGQTTPPAVAPQPQHAGTIYGVDISNHQDGLSCELVAAEGFDFCIIKATEGTWKDPILHSHLEDARRTDMHIAAYVYVWGTTSAQDHAQALDEHLGDTSVPIALDIETNSGYSADHWRSVRDAIEDRGYTVILTYLPEWYWQEAGQPDLTGLPPLWSSRYPSTTAAFASLLYADAGRRGWQGYGGLDVSIWQFTDRALVAGRQIDANAFEGTPATLAALFNGEITDLEGEELTMADMQKIIDTIHEEGRKTREYLDTRVTGPIGTDVKDIRQQITGGRDSIPGDLAASYPGWDPAKLVATARAKSFVGLTMTEMAAVAIAGTDHDLQSARFAANTERADNE